ncbi:anaphase-promoting complex subunit Hcn1, partial [Entophlyctis luteolus]
RKAASRILKDLNCKLELLELNLFHIEPLVARLSEIFDIEKPDSDMITQTTISHLTASADVYNLDSETKNDAELLRNLGFDYVQPSSPIATKEALHNPSRSEQSADSLERDKIFNKAELKEKEENCLWSRLHYHCVDQKSQSQSSPKPSQVRRDFHSAKNTIKFRDDEIWRSSATRLPVNSGNIDFPKESDTAEQRIERRGYHSSEVNSSGTKNPNENGQNETEESLPCSCSSVCGQAGSTLSKKSGSSLENSKSRTLSIETTEEFPTKITEPAPIIKTIGWNIATSPISEANRLSSLKWTSTPSFNDSMRLRRSTVVSKLANATAKAKYNEKGSLLSVSEMERNATNMGTPENDKDLSGSIDDSDKIVRLCKCGLNPRSSFNVYRELVMGLFYIIVAWIIPFELGFDIGLHWSFKAFIFVIFGVDTIVESVTLRSSHSALSSKKTPSLKDWQAYYFSGLFWIDLISTFPFEFLPIAGADYLLSIHLIRLYKLPSILISSPMFISMRKNLESALGIGQTFSGIFPLMFALCAFLHIETCAIFLVGTWADFSNTAIAQVQYKSPGDQYAWALFNAVGNTFSMTYNIRKRPTATSEQLVVVVFIITGAGLYASIVGTVSSFAMGFDASGRFYKQKIDELHEYMHWKDISHTTKRKVAKYYEIKYRGKFFEEATLLSEMNGSLRMEIAIQNCKGLIQKVDFLRRETGDGKDDLFLGRIATALRTCYFVAGDIIITQGEIGADMVGEN